MNDQCRDETPRGALTEQLELDLPDDGSFFCTRACEGVSVSPHHVDAELRVNQEDVPLTGTAVSSSSQNPTSDEENSPEQEISEDQIDPASEEARERVCDGIHQRVMGALRDALADAGVSKRYIDMGEDFVGNALADVIEDSFEVFNLWEIV